MLNARGRCMCIVTCLGGGEDEAAVMYLGLTLCETRGSVMLDNLCS